MRVQVQSKHNLDEELFVNIWRRSALDECFDDWRRQPQTNLGDLSSNSTFFWMNWFCTNKGLMPVFDLDTEPKEWRIIVNPIDDAEKEKSVIFKEDETSVYVYQFNTGELTRFLFVPKDWPRLLEIQVNDIPEWLAEKIAVAKEEKSPRAIESRLNDLAARLQQLKQRRS